MKEIVKIRIAVAFLAVTAVFVLLALLGDWGKFGIFAVLVLPFEWAGSLIRTAGGVNNFLAFVIYFAVCLLPIVFPVIRCVKSKRVSPINIAWVVLSVALFASVYFFINPHKIKFVIPAPFEAEFNQITLIGIAITFYAALIVCLVTEFFYSQKKKEERIYTYAKVLLVLLIVGVLFSVFFTEVLAVKSQFATLKQNIESAGSIGDVGYVVNKDANIFVILLSFVLELIPAIVTIALFLRATLFIDNMRTDMFARENVAKLQGIIGWSVRTIFVTLGCMIIRNVTCMLMFEKLINMYYSVDIPLGMILTACLVMLFSKILMRAVSINDENKLVI